MGKNDRNYTVEVRRMFHPARVDMFVLMGQAGIAYLPEINTLTIEEHLQSVFSVDADMVKVLLYLAKAGAAVRYYAEENRVSAQFILEDSET